MSRSSSSSAPFTVLGINMYQKDSAACLVQNGRVLAAADEERFRRIKHYGGFPREAVCWCLHRAGLRLEEVHSIVGPLPEKAVFRELGLSPKALAPSPLTYKPFPDEPRGLGSHHLWHAASAYYTSGFDHAAVLTADAMGNNDSAVYYLGRGRELKRQAAIDYRIVSLGGMYQNISEHLGFGEFGAGKVMGLAPYGSVMDGWRDLLDILSFDQAESRWRHDPKHPLKRILRLPGEALTQEHKDLAATVQHALEQSIINLMREIHEQSGETRFCLSGGVFLNCAMNGKLARLPFVDELYLHPNATDGGTAVGAALEESVRYWTEPLPKIRTAAWGPEFSEDDIARALNGFAHKDALTTSTPQDLSERAARCIADGGIIGYFDGPLEWGPRALGRRSLLADPRNESMWERVNRVKGREAWRPLAPSVLAEEAPHWFEDYRESLFMLMAFALKKDKANRVPAIFHVDGTARPQAVFAEENPAYHALISAFHRQTGVPMVLNTSFNDRNEPIVCTPEDALRTAWKLRLSGLVIGPFWVEGFDRVHTSDGRCRVRVPDHEGTQAARWHEYSRVRGLRCVTENETADLVLQPVNEIMRPSSVPKDSAPCVLVDLPLEPSWLLGQNKERLNESPWLVHSLMGGATTAMKRILSRGAIGPLRHARLIRRRLGFSPRMESLHQARPMRILSHYLTQDLALLAFLELWPEDSPLRTKDCEGDLRRLEMRVSPQNLRETQPGVWEIRYGQRQDGHGHDCLLVVGEKGTLRLDLEDPIHVLYLGLTESGPFNRIWMQETPRLEQEALHLLHVHDDPAKPKAPFNHSFWMRVSEGRDALLKPLVAKEYRRVRQSLEQDTTLEKQLSSGELVSQTPSQHLRQLGLSGSSWPTMEHLHHSAFFEGLRHPPSFLWCAELPRLLLDLQIEDRAVFENHDPRQVMELTSHFERMGYTVATGERYAVDAVHARRRDQGSLTTLYVAKERDVALELAELERILKPDTPDQEVDRAERRAGELLGYPSCCIAGFRNAYLSDVGALFKQQGLLHTAGRPLALLNNILPFRVISHFPHAYDCQDSAAWMSRRVQGLSQGLPGYLEGHGLRLDDNQKQEVLDNLERFYAMPTLYWDFFRYVLFDGALFGNELRYQAVFGPLDLVEPQAKKRFTSQFVYRAFHLDLVERFREGNRLVLEPKRLVLYRDDRQLDSLEMLETSRMMLFDWQR